MGAIFALLSATSWGISNALIRRAQNNTSYSINIGTFLTIIINNVINICVLSIILILQGPIEITAIGVFFFAIGGLLNSCIGRSFLFRCFNRIGSARGGVIKGLMPIFVILGGVIFLKEQMSHMMWAGVIVILGGVYTISFDTLNKVSGLENNKGEKMLLREGIIIGIISCLFLASGNLMRKVGLQYINNSVLGVTIGSFVGLLAYGIYFLIKGDKKQIALALKTFNKDYLFGGIFTSAALYLVFFSMQLIPISVTNSVAASEPLFTIIMSYLLLKNNKENITYLTVIGGFLIIIGTVILMLF